MPDPRKPELRARLLAARRGLPQATLDTAARRVRAEVETLVRGHPGTVAGYRPYRTEPGGPDLPGVLAPLVGRLLLPVLRDDRDLDWAPAGGPSSGPSSGPVLGPDAIRAATLVIVPALAVDRYGIRLGRGGGSYDRALARVAPGVEVVALLHDGELHDDPLHDDPLPAEPHDRPVTAAVTPARGLVRLPASS